MTRTAPIVFAAIAASLFGNVAVAADACVRYGEALHGLGGIVEIRAFYGPPNYGENPESDRREVQGLLFLDKPLCVDASEKTQEPAESAQAEITLVLDDKPRMNLSTLAGLHVTVDGKLFHGFTGHHRTALLLALDGAPRVSRAQGRPASGEHP